jgi:hypothetical protein
LYKIGVVGTSLFAFLTSASLSSEIVNLTSKILQPLFGGKDCCAPSVISFLSAGQGFEQFQVADVEAPREHYLSWATLDIEINAWTSAGRYIRKGI